MPRLHKEAENCQLVLTKKSNLRMKDLKRKKRHGDIDKRVVQIGNSVAWLVLS